MREDDPLTHELDDAAVERGFEEHKRFAGSRAREQIEGRSRARGELYLLFFSSAASRSCGLHMGRKRKAARSDRLRKSLHISYGPNRTALKPFG